MRKPRGPGKIPPERRLTNSCLRVLDVILKASGPMTIREVGKACGWTGIIHQMECVRRLVAAGLVAQEPGNKRRTIRPTCRVEVIS